jgi:Dolichyl-phosphate-mannose-protein mannosyltransferase
VVGAVAAGIAVRIWVARTPAIGYLDSDEAVPGLMARHMLHGQFPKFYWGQDYGGTPEIGLLAAAFWVFGSSVAVLRAVPIALYAVGALLLWRIGRRTIGEPGATIAAALFWVWPAYFVWRSTREYGYYAVLLVCGLGLMLAALRLREQPNLQDTVLAGLLLGVGWWSSLQIALVGLPTLLWLLWRQPRVVRYAPIGLLVASAVAAPWIDANVRSGWASLSANPTHELARTYAYRLGGLVADGVPTVLGLRVPFTGEWLPARIVGAAAAALICVALAVAVVRRRRSLELVVVILVPFPFLYAASGFTYNRLEPRYLGFLAPLLALIAAALLADVRVAAIALATTTALTTVALVRLRDAGVLAPAAPDVRAPTTVTPVIHVLDRAGVTRGWADYWVAFRITFLTHERIVIAPNESPRFPAYNSLVEASDRIARIFVTGTVELTRQRRSLVASGYRPTRAGPYTVFLPGS